MATKPKTHTSAAAKPADAAATVKQCKQPAAKARGGATKGQVPPVHPTPTVPASKPICANKASAPSFPPPAPKQRISKQAVLIDLLGSPGGTTIAQMMAATGWQAHSVRGVISGTLRKKLALNVISEVSAVGAERTYRILV